MFSEDELKEMEKYAAEMQVVKMDAWPFIYFKYFSSGFRRNKVLKHWH